MKEYDFLVVGSGTGKKIASQASEKGLDVALVDKDEFGGTCLLRGCVPSKTMIYPGDVIQEAKEAEGIGVDVQDMEIDFQKIMENTRDSYRSSKKKLSEAVEEDENTDFYNEVGKFVDDYTMEIGDETIRADKIVLFSGARPVVPPIEGIEEVDYLTNRNIFDMEEKPESLVVIGGGYIGVEFAHLFSAVGTEVTIVEMTDGLVPGQASGVSDILEEKLSERMDVLTNHRVVEVSEEDGMKFVKAETESGEVKELEGEEILLAVGRRSNADLLEVENTGVETDEDGWIKVDENLRTSKENIWAGGDAVGDPMLKHMANHEASVLAHNIFSDHEIPVDYHAVPYAIFTRPQVAGVGMTVEEANQEHELLVSEGNYSDTAKGFAMGEPDGFCRIIVDKEERTILGAHIVGPHAAMLVQQIVNLMYVGDGTIDPLFNSIYIHPSLSEVITSSMGNWKEV